MTPGYNFKNIRTLLTEGFTEEELRRLCYDEPNFQDIYDQLAQSAGKTEIIDQLIKYAHKKLEFETLLKWAKENNPKRYEQHKPYEFSINLTPPNDTPGKLLNSLSEQNHDSNTSNKELDPTQTTVSPFVQFIANLLVLGILTYLFYGKVVMDCVPNGINAFSSAIIAIIVFHIVWHYLYPVFTLSGKFSLFGFEIDLKSFFILLDILHPRLLPVIVLWGVAIVLIPSASIIGFTNLSPFALKDPIPIIKDFTVTYPNKQKSVVLPGDTIKIVPDEQILIEATVSQQASSPCEWFVSNGKKQPAAGCAVLYSPNFNVKHDTVAVLIQSLCQEKQTFAGTHISVIPSP